MSEVKKVPEIRFAGFAEPWEQRKFGDDLNSIQTGTNKLGSPENAGMPLLKMGNIQRGYFSLDKLEYLIEGDEAEPENIAQNGDFFFNTRNTLELVGKGATWFGESGKYAFNSNIARFDLGEIDTVFFNYLYNTEQMQKQVHARAMGTTSVAAIYPRTLDSIEYSLPSKEEQRKIGKYMYSLDNLLTLHQRKHDKLAVLKKAMLEKMFPQNGSSVPEVRFAGFTGPWEQRKLSEIADKVTEKNVGLQYIETFTNSAEFGIISQRDFFDHDIAKMSSLDGYYIVRNEDFVYNPRISTAAPVGPINRNKLSRVGVMSPLYTVFRPHDVDTTYLEYFFKSKYWHSFMNFNGDSGARSDRFSIKDSVFFEMPIPIPHIDEQRKIGAHLTNLDHLISLHQRKHESLKHVKAALLQKMFV